MTTRPDDETRPPRRTSIEVTAQDNAQVHVAAGDMTVVNGAPPAPVTALRTLLRDTPAFTGRGAELERLLTGTEQGGAPVIHTIDGMPGVGKTTLALHAAHLLADRFPDGQILLELHAHSPGQHPVGPADALGALLLCTGIAPENIPRGQDDRARLWRDRLAGKRVLLLLDDAADQAQVEPLLPGTGDVLVLITSRRRLVALDGAAPLTVGPLPPGDAAELFVRLARRTPATAEDAAAVTLTVDLCGHLPLAVALAAGHFAAHREWSFATVPEKLSGARDRLEQLATGHKGVAAAFDMSYRALTPERQRLLRYLGLHPGTDIDADATAALAGTPVGLARRELEALYTSHLVDSATADRFRLHDLIRSYARMLADQESDRDRDRGIGRLLDHYQHTAEAADRLLAQAPLSRTGAAPPAHVRAPATYEAALAWMLAERSNLIACTRYANATARHARTLRLTAALASFLHLQGPWDEAVALHRAAADAAVSAGDEHGEALALRELSRMRAVAGDYQEAAGLAGRARDLFRALGDRRGEAAALGELGRTRAMTGDLTAAAGLFQQAGDLYRAVGDRHGEGTALRELGQVRAVTGAFPEALELLPRALDLYRSLGDRLGEAHALRDLGRTRAATADYREAAELLPRALELYRALGSRHGEAATLGELGRVRYVTGDYREAADLAGQALDLCRALGSRHGEATATWELGRVRSVTGDHREAAGLFERAGDLFRAIGNLHGEAHTLQDLGRVRTQTGHHTAAAGLLERSLGLFRKVGDRLGEAEVLNSQGALLTASAGPEEALAAYRGALDLAREVTSPLDEAHALEGSAHCHERTGATEAAVAALRRAVGIYQRIGAAEAPGAAARLARLSA
ncbi:ATP-binding protein [Streptomyces johnsoniae]|uniref:Tetratricopeptide repeat protein n=1 Tax=Streptomyces johnsoniae TaxID=3075532 RepID=A0ABU2S7I5_9ACTN|nr:tetratricopeptide repeat protein [Streptomyces sp. DSM 41886]MDT0443610.1 tetratricopeptide repeat protein [Streptomyces sp. DSM 41886]